MRIHKCELIDVEHASCKVDKQKVPPPARLGSEMTMSLNWFAQHLERGSRPRASNMLNVHRKNKRKVQIVRTLGRPF